MQPTPPEPSSESRSTASHRPSRAASSDVPCIIPQCPLSVVDTIRHSPYAAGQSPRTLTYFLASYEDDPAKMAAAIRAHWAIENSLHWVLDVTFREDECRVRDRTAAANFAMLRKIALNLIKQDSTAKTSLKARRKKAAWNDEYMAQVIAGKFHA